MVERRRPLGSGDGGADDYKVGYGKPPLHSRFAPGQSVYPKGRRKGTRNLKTDVKRTLAAPVKVRVGDRMRTRSTQEAALMILREKALHGNERALERLLELARCHNSDDPVDAGETRPLGEDDQAILATYVAQTAAPSSDPPDEMDQSDLSPSAPPWRKKKLGQ
jgi:hypothetical protein